MGFWAKIAVVIINKRPKFEYILVISGTFGFEKMLKTNLFNQWVKINHHNSDSTCLHYS